MTRAVLAVVACAGLLAANVARACRGCDVDDADVVREGALVWRGEGRLAREAGGGPHAASLPGVTLALGAPGLLEVGVSAARRVTNLEGEPSPTFVDVELGAKKIVRAGSAQRGTGLSLALAPALLIPTHDDGPWVGLRAVGIASAHGPLGTAHVSLGVAWTRERETRFLAGLRLDGPEDWRLQPIAELSLERGRKLRALGSVFAGFVVHASESATLGFGVRRRRGEGQTTRAATAGFELEWPRELW